MALDPVLLAASGLKLILIVTCAVVLHLLNPAYAFHSSDYGIQSSWTVIFTYLACAITLLYVVVSILIHAFTNARCKEDVGTCAISEVVFAAGGMMSWLLIAGISGSISRRSGDYETHAFGWISGLSALNVLIFLLLSVVFCGLVGMKSLGTPKR